LWPELFYYKALYVARIVVQQKRCRIGRCGPSFSTTKRCSSNCCTTKRCRIGRCSPSFSTTKRCSSNCSTTKRRKLRTNFSLIGACFGAPVMPSANQTRIIIHLCPFPARITLGTNCRPDRNRRVPKPGPMVHDIADSIGEIRCI
jgi:hypothetical protein